MTTAVSSTVSAIPPNRLPGAFIVRPAHLATLVQQIERKSRHRAIAVQVPGTWAGGELLSLGDVSWRVVRAASVLAIREALAEHEEAGPDDRVIILTTLQTQELGWDVIARIAKYRVFTLESWELLQDLFRARSVDPRVTQIDWLADVLLEYAPAGGYAPSPSGVLDLETAWTQALTGLLGMHGGGAPDALTVLRWSTHDNAAARWASLSAEVRAGIEERIGETAGATGEILARALSVGRTESLVALGLVCSVLWPQEPVDDAALRDLLAAARVRLETLVGGVAPQEAVARNWGTLARRLLSELPADRAASERSRAERLLEDLRAEAAAELSAFLPAGAAQRARRLGQAIAAWLANTGDVAGVESAQRRFVAHEGILGTARDERATMAVRLVRAMSAGAPFEESGFGGLVRHHVEWWSWVDAARTVLFGGEVSSDLSVAYRLLLESAGALRESETQRFAERLVQWNSRPAAEPDVLPVERVLELIAGPVSQTRDVLVLLLDGLELNVWRRLLSDVAARGWTWWQPAAATIAPVGIATLPSVTASSRASFFAGKVKGGDKGTEREDFAEHQSLRRSGSRAPVLFHKGELGAANALAPVVRDAIASRQRVVGAVVNAVDDWLSRSDQTLPRWSVSAIPLLEALLQEAAEANRVVIIASDHGHILDLNTQQLGRGEGARWRLPTSEATRQGEILADGPRVRDASGHDSIVLAVSEKIRYAGKQAGYHGGATPQEIIAPIAVLSRDELGIEGWRPVIDASPAWWQDPRDHAEETPFVRNESSVLSQRAAGSPAPTRAVSGWIGAVLSSTVYEAQKNLAGRMAPHDEQMQAVLAILDRYQGRAPRAAVAAALALPEVRVRGLLANVRRVLNVEGFAVLEEEESTATLLLNRALLDVQFGINV